MNIWPIIKVTLIVIATTGSLFDTPYTEHGEVLGWQPVIAGLLFFPVIVLVGLLVLKVIFRRKLDFEVPNWWSNPLDFSHPEHFFHLGGMVMLASGIGGLAAAYFRSGKLSALSFTPLAFGVGILAGIWILKVVNAQQSTSSNKVL